MLKKEMKFRYCMFDCELIFVVAGCSNLFQQRQYCNRYVVVNFLSQVIFVFLLFLGMVIYANEVETKEK